MIIRTLALLFAALAALSAQADTFPILHFHGGERWTYGFSVQNSNGALDQFEQEYSLAYKNGNGQYILVSRKPGLGYVWSGARPVSADRCFIYIVDPSDTIGSEFCGGDVKPGQTITKRSEFSKMTVTYKGQEAMTVRGGNFIATHFSIEESLFKSDAMTPAAKSRVWDYWFAEQARGFVKFRLRHLDDTKTVIRSIDIELINMTLQ